MSEFEKLDVKPGIIQNILFLGFEEMTRIQRMVIPEAVKNRDIIGQAKTGTGKTFAFAIPVLNKIDIDRKSVQALVLTPTRELAVQVALEMEKLTGSSIKVALSYGGASINIQTDALKRGAHMVVGTPGRVMDHIRRKTLKLDGVHTFVLDEADRMLDMGFIGDIEWITQRMPKKRQTMLFSATMPVEIHKLAEKYMSNPVTISASSDEDEMTVGDIEQFYYQVPQRKKIDSFLRIYKNEKPSKALIFCRTKTWVEKLYGILKKKGMKVERIHGDMTQKAREKAIDKLKNSKVESLVCTDVVSRGIDIYDISHVFNYDLPQEPMTYIHRIGRTGRAGKKGIAITLIQQEQIRDLWLVEHKARTSIEERHLD